MLSISVVLPVLVLVDVVLWWYLNFFKYFVLICGQNSVSGVYCSLLNSNFETLHFERKKENMLPSKSLFCLILEPSKGGRATRH